jgi:thiamine biosynthesis lipoprotein
MKLVKCLSILIILLNTVSCEQHKEEFVRIDGFTMGTTYQVTFEKKTLEAQQLKNEIDSRLNVINQLMSTYIDDSELSLFNQSDSTNCQTLSQDTLYVIKNALAISKQTNGKFDVTLAPLIEAWGFDKKNTNDSVPSQESIRLLLNKIGYSKIIVGNDCVAKQSKDVSVNLSAIAKGYAVDEIAKLLERKKIAHYLVEIGGEIANKGHNASGVSWRLAIESASTEKRSIQRVFAPKGLGVATSGDYRNYFEKDGKRFSHTIDPTTGYPISHQLASVTVLHKETMLADAIATAMMVMGPEASLEYADRHQLAIFMLVKNKQGYEEIYSQAFKAYLQ